MAAELSGRFYKDRPGLAALALSTNTSAVTAIGNDFGYDAVFARQLDGLARPGDIVVGISTSGRSESVLAALRKAREMNLHSTGMTGRGGGELPLDRQPLPPDRLRRHAQNPGRTYPRRPHHL